jgi:2-iminobutanoate/2-iminopropanoate deaminase
MIVQHALGKGETMTSQPTGEVIATDGAPAAIGPYSQAIKANGLVYTAGQIPIDPATKALVEGDIRAQTERVMQNLEAVLGAAGSSFERVVKTTCFLANLDDFPAFNEVYGRRFSANPPARSTVQVARLPMGALVEVECVALAD